MRESAKDKLTQIVFWSIIYGGQLLLIGLAIQYLAEKVL